MRVSPTWDGYSSTLNLTRWWTKLRGTWSASSPLLKCRVRIHSARQRGWSFPASNASRFTWRKCTKSFCMGRPSGSLAAALISYLEFVYLACSEKKRIKCQYRYYSNHNCTAFPISTRYRLLVLLEPLEFEVERHLREGSRLYLILSFNKLFLQRSLR